MKVISFVTQKGGSGKTTLAINCAVAASGKRRRVLILDMDNQGSAENWYQDREASEPQLVRITAAERKRRIKIMADKIKVDLEENSPYRIAWEMTREIARIEGKLNKENARENIQTIYSECLKIVKSGWSYQAVQNEKNKQR